MPHAPLSSRRRRNSEEGLITFNYSPSAADILDIDDPPLCRNRWQSSLCRLFSHLVTFAIFPIFGVMVLKVACDTPYKLAQDKNLDTKFPDFFSVNEFMATADILEYLRENMLKLEEITTNPTLHQIHPLVINQLKSTELTYNTTCQLLNNSLILERRILSDSSPDPNSYQNEQLIFGASISISFFVCFFLVALFLTYKHGISTILYSYWTNVYIALLAFLLGVVYAGLRVYWDPFYLDEPITDAASILKKDIPHLIN